MRSEYLGACDEPQSKTTLLTARVANGNHTDKRSNPTEIVRADNQATGGGDGSNEVGGLLQARTKTPPSVLKGGGPSSRSLK